MTTLTKEYFDERLDAVHSEIQELARITANGFAELEKRLDVRERVDTLETKVKKLESALNLQL